MIALPEELARRMRKHAAACYPDECCGALLGVVAGTTRQVRELMELENRTPGDTRGRGYRVASADYRRVEEAARGHGLELLGFYHSHPDHPARPSDTDRDQALPWFSYVIVSVEQGVSRDLTGWILADDRSRFHRDDVIAGEAVTGRTPCPSRS